MERIPKRDINAIIADIAIGASSSIEIGIASPYLNRLDLVRDYAHIVDNRLTRRLLLALEHDGFLFVPRLANDIRLFLDSGWEVRSGPYNRLRFTVLVDNEFGFQDPSDPRKRPPALANIDKKDILEFRRAFDYTWEKAIKVESIYREKTEDEDKEEIANIVQVSSEQFADLIKYFAKHPEKMREMPPRKFEEFIADLFVNEGHKVELTKMTRDGGRDILVFSESSLGKHLHLIECKRHAVANPIDVKLVRSLYGVVEQERATAGMLITTTHFTPPAVKFIDSVKNRLAKKDYDETVQWIKKHAEL